MRRSKNSLCAINSKLASWREHELHGAVRLEKASYEVEANNLHNAASTHRPLLILMLMLMLFSFYSPRTESTRASSLPIAPTAKETFLGNEKLPLHVLNGTFAHLV